MTYHVKEGEPHFTEGIPVEYKRVYLWNWVVRAMHWISALSIVVLFVTGFYIGRPYFVSGGEAIDHFLMGRFRFAHFAAAAVLVATAMIRQSSRIPVPVLSTPIPTQSPGSGSASQDVNVRPLASR